MPTEVFFNRPGQPIPVERLYREIRDARHRLTVASAWFTDTRIADAIIDSPAPDKLVLLNAADLGRGDKRAVQLVKQAAAVSAEERNGWSTKVYRAWCELPMAERQEVKWEVFEAAWAARIPRPSRFRMVVLGSRDFTQGVMHHKFIAIDDRMVWTGSFNFTFNAQRNYENLVRIDETSVVWQFHDEAHECAEHIWADDNDGMLVCAECRQRFYPDEDPDAADSHGGFTCRKCRTTSAVTSFIDAMPDPRLTPPAKPLAPKRQVRIGGKK